MAEHLETAIYKGSISVSEYRKLRDAADDAEAKGAITYLTKNGRPYAAIVPVDVAAVSAPIEDCYDCSHGTHRYCNRYHGGFCPCDNRQVHMHIEAEAAARAGLKYR